MSGDTKKPGNFFSSPTRRADQPSAEPPASDPLRNRTRRIDTPVPPQNRPNQPAMGGAGLTPATRIWRPGQQESAEGAPTSNAEQADGDDYVVGWLVIVDGPGKGIGLALGYGWNSIGRGEDQRVRLDFGDGEISRETHCAVAYDGKNRKFFIQHGGGRNLTYLGDDPVLAPQELQANARISLGRTSLQFVPFCGGSFDWADVSNAAPD